MATSLSTFGRPSTRRLSSGGYAHDDFGNYRFSNPSAQISLYPFNVEHTVGSTGGQGGFIGGGDPFGAPLQPSTGPGYDNASAGRYQTSPMRRAGGMTMPAGGGFGSSTSTRSVTSTRPYSGSNAGGFSAFGGGLQGSGGGPGSMQNAGSRNVGSVNWGAFSGLGQFIDQNPGGAAYLRSMGMPIPTYNGIPYDQLGAGPQRIAPSTTVRGGFGSAGRSRIYAGMGAGGGGRGGGEMGGTLAMRGGAPVGLAGGAGVFGGTGSVGSAGGLENTISDAYTRALGSGGRTLSASDEAVQSQRAADAVNRASRDAISAARMDAARRGDTSMSSIGDREDRIRQRGAEGATRARQDVSIANNQDAMRNLIALLGSAGGYANNRAEIEMLIGQLQQGQLGNTLAMYAPQGQA